MENHYELDRQFERAVDKVNRFLEPIPSDTLLRLYAYYRKANGILEAPKRNGVPLIAGFKANALFQVRHVLPEEAKRRYIEIVRTDLDPTWDPATLNRSVTSATRAS